MKKYIWLLSILGIVFFTACGSSSKEAKELQTKQLKLIGIPQDIVANICQDDNTNGICESTELQAKVSFSQGDNMETIWSKLTLTSEGRYLLETYDPSKPLLLELKDAKSQHFTESFTLPFDGLKENEEEKELSILQTMIDKDALVPNNVSSAKVMKNVDDFYKVLLADLEQNIKILKEKGLTTKQAVAGNINEMADELITNGIENTIPARMNTCNGDQTCVDTVLKTLSTELVLTDAEANTISRNAEVNEPEVINNNPNQGKIDRAEYFPTNSVTKSFTTKMKSPFQEESVSTYSETISKNNNTFTYQDQDSQDNSYSTATIDSNNIVVKWTNVNYDNNEYKINRYINQGDTTWKWTYSYKDEQSTTAIDYTCKLEDTLSSFSHGGYKYSGDIIVEKCTVNTKTTYQYNNISDTIESSTVSYQYNLKNVGYIASVSDICYDDRGIAQNTQGCTPNGYTYTYLEQ
jgi:hypothetical protein